MKKFIPPTILFCFLLCLLETVSFMGWLNETLFPSPSKVILSYVEEFEFYFYAFLETSQSSLFGFVLAMVIGWVIALLLSLSTWLKSALLPFAVFFQTVPIIAIAPVIVIYLGFGTSTVVFCSALVAIFPIIANTLIGLSQVSTSHLQLFDLYQARWWQKLFRLRIPSAVPFMLSGLRVSAGLSVIGVVAGEFVAGGGLGSLIEAAKTQQRLDLVYGALFLLAFVGIVLLSLVDLVSFALMRWRPLGYEYRK